MKVLITITPRMYRESVALALQSSRADFEVMLGSERSPDVSAWDFRPHLLIRDDSHNGDLANVADVLCLIEILYSDSMGARIKLDGEVWIIEDMSTKDLLEITDRTQRIVLAMEE